MHNLQLQALRAALAELQGDIKADAGPIAQRKIHIISTLIANAIVSADLPSFAETIDDELRDQRASAVEEQKLIADAGQPADRADLSEVALTAYLRSRLGASVTVTKAHKLVGGASKQTIILTLEGADTVGNTLVLRRDLVGGPVVSESADEFSVTQQLHARGLAVAEPVWADRAPPFGGTCMVTRFVAGDQAMDLTDAAQRDGGREASLALARILGAIHSVPLGDLDLPARNDGKSLRDQVVAMIDDYDNQWQRRRVDVSPTIAAALCWLRDNVPGSGELSLVHGDASLRNLMIDKGRASALLDWELWHVGDHHEDMAYCQVDVVPRLEWSEFLAEYQRHGGKPVDPQALVFWGMFGAVRNMIFAAVLAYNYATFDRPPAAAMFMALAGGRPLAEMVAQQLKELQERPA